MNAAASVQEVAGERAGVSAMPDGERKARAWQSVPGGCLVIDGQRDDLSEGAGGVLEGAELGVAVRAPRPAGEQDHAESAGQGVRHGDDCAARKGQGPRGCWAPGGSKVMA